MPRQSNSAAPIDLDDLGVPPLPDELSPEERAKAYSLLNVSDDPSIPLETRVPIPGTTHEMLGKKNSKKSGHEKVLSLYRAQKFSPLTQLVRRCKIEGAKVELYERAQAMGMEERVLSSLPKPDKKMYLSLLLELVKYEVPAYSSMPLPQQGVSGITVNVINQAPQERIIEIDSGAPEKLRLQATQNGHVVLPTAVTIEEAQPVTTGKEEDF